MGTTASSPQSTWTPPDRQAPRDHDRFLGEANAWAVATAWHEHLRGADVALSCERDGPVTGIVDRYGWIYVHAALASPRSVAVTHCAVLTWRALSRCTGFGADENPVFWRRVFSFLSASLGTGTERPFIPARAVEVSDAVRFFGGGDAVFPRIMVAVHCLGDKGGQGDVVFERVRQLCGLSNINVDSASRTRYDQLVATLRPYHIDTRPCEPIDVCLEVTLRPGDLSVVLPRLRKLLEETHALAPSAAATRLRRVQFSGTLVVRNAAEVQLVDDLLRDDLCAIGSLWVGPPGRLTFADTRKYIRAITGVARPPPSKPRELAIDRSAWSNHAYEALMSALPFSTSVHSLRLHVAHSPAVVESHDLPWLAYALFHPHTPRSSWRHLELLDVAPRARTSEIFQAMARGNNLLALLVGAPADCTAYFSTVLPEGTQVKRQPKDDAPTLLVAASEGDDSCDVDVCVSSTDVSSWSEWVAVIVRGSGVGWVRSYLVHDVVTRASTPTPSLTGLRVAPKRDADRPLGEYTAGTLVYVLRALGSNLKYLDMAAFGEVRLSTVQLILGELCPNLASLVCTNNGSLWSPPLAPKTMSDHDGDSALATQGATLRELEILMSLSGKRLDPPSKLVLRSWLKNLSALRITTTTPRKSRSLLAADRETLRAVLTELPWLQYLHLDTPPPLLTHRSGSFNIPIADEATQRFREGANGHSTLPMTKYDADRSVTRDVVRSLALSARVADFADGAITSRCKRALLSVARPRHHDAGSPVRALLGRMDEIVFATIFAFATTAVPREVCIAQA